MLQTESASADMTLSDYEAYSEARAHDKELANIEANMNVILNRDKPEIAKTTHLYKQNNPAEIPYLYSIISLAGIYINLSNTLQAILQFSLALR